jgi:peptide methionine sulfoxide reductase msrA/msrB
VLATTVGYCGGRTTQPTYEQVSNGESGHVEAVAVDFNPQETSFEDLVKVFFESHDFTQINRQGPDIGKQYRSEIFYSNETQRQTATKLIAILKEKGYQVATRLTPAGQFWPAEEYHQQYYQKKGGTPYCHLYRQVF